MLQQFFLDWNTAMQSRTVEKETKNKNGIITFQQTKFTFRNHAIIMYSNIVSQTENLQPDRRRWQSELFVPDTNKIIPGTPFPSRTKCAIAILSALTEGREHEDKVAERARIRRQMFAAKAMSERLQKFAGSSFTDDEKKILVDWFGNHADKKYWIDNTISAMVKYHYYITGRGLIEHGINLGNEANTYIQRIYGTVAQLILESVVNQYNVPTLKRVTAAKFFLQPRNNLSTGVYTIRSGLAKLFDECKSPAQFMFLVNALAVFYEHFTGVPLDKKIEEEKIRRENIRERYAKDKANNVQHHRKGAPRNSVRIFSMNAVPVGSTLGDVFGDVLDNAVNDKQEKVKTPPPAKKKHAPVTDAQVNSKQREAQVRDESPKAEVPVTPEHESETSTETQKTESNTIDNPVIPAGFELPAEDTETKKTTRRKTTTKPVEPTDTIAG